MTLLLAFTLAGYILEAIRSFTAKRRSSAPERRRRGQGRSVAPEHEAT